MTPQFNIQPLVDGAVINLEHPFDSEIFDITEGRTVKVTVIGYRIVHRRLAGIDPSNCLFTIGETGVFINPVLLCAGVDANAAKRFVDTR